MGLLRAASCREGRVHARIKPDFRDYEGNDPVGFVLSLDLHRRHLNESQRAMVAARIATLDKGANQHAQICAPSQSKAGEQLQVSRRSVQDAKAVLRDAAPEVVAAVERGDLAVSAAAKVATRPAEEQVAIVERLDAAKAEKGVAREELRCRTR